MKHLIAALAICVATNTHYSEDIPTVLLPPPPLEEPQPEVAEEPKPDFSKIKIAHVRKYVQSIYPYAAKIQQEHRIPAPITLAIACVESGYGRSYIAKNKFNHLGIRNWQQGKPSYRRFSSTEACFEYYSNMFNKKRYRSLRTVESEDLDVWVKKIQECGYNPFESYRHELMKMIRFVRLDELV